MHHMEIICRPNISGDICLIYFYWYLLILMRTTTLSYSVVIRMTIIHYKGDFKTPSTECEPVTSALLSARIMLPDDTHASRRPRRSVYVNTRSTHPSAPATDLCVRACSQMLRPHPALLSASAYNTATDSLVHAGLQYHDRLSHPHGLTTSRLTRPWLTSASPLWSSTPRRMTIGLTYQVKSIQYIFILHIAFFKRAITPAFKIHQYNSSLRDWVIFPSNDLEFLKFTETGRLCWVMSL